MAKILFVDIDETIINLNSHIELINLLITKKKSFLYRIFLSKFFYFLDYLSIIDLKKIHLKIIKGQHKKDIDRFCYKIINSPNIFNKKIIKIINKYQSEGYKIILLSETISEFGELISKKFNFENYYCSEFDYENSFFTGKYKKIHNKLETIKLYGEPIKYLITDNIKDLNLNPYLKKILFIKNYRNKQYIKKNINKFNNLELII